MLTIFLRTNRRIIFCINNSDSLQVSASLSIIIPWRLWTLCQCLNEDFDFTNSNHKIIPFLSRKLGFACIYPFKGTFRTMLETANLTDDCTGHSPPTLEQHFVRHNHRSQRQVDHISSHAANLRSFDWTTIVSSLAQWGKLNWADLHFWDDYELEKQISSELRSGSLGQWWTLPSWT